jgi:hypothetical protein
MLMGKRTEFRGVPTFTHHYHGLMNARIKQGDVRKEGVFNVKNCRYFLQSGLACRAQSYPDDVLNPCCKLRQLTGDGTAFGIPVKNVLHCPPVWYPKKPVKQPHKWSRMDRCVIRPRRDINITRKDAKEGRTFFKNVLTGMKSDTMPHIRDIEDRLKDIVHPDVLAEIIRFVALPKCVDSFQLLRIMKVIASEDCVSSMFQLPVLHSLEQILSAGENENWTKLKSLMAEHKAMLGQRGLALCVWEIFSYQLRHHSIVFASTLRFIRFLGSTIHSLF